MICVSVAPESRTLARADIFNASLQADIVELCLDKLLKMPDVGEIIEGFSKPILVSCRRKEDGGHYKGTEQERLAILRQAIVAGPAYVELELDVAGNLPRFGETKRVVSHTSLGRPLSNADIEDVFTRAAKANADVVKFTWPTPTLDAAWPLLSAVSKKRELPVVGIGRGPAGVTFSLLGRKYGSPWIYAGLERGLEAFEGQPTVFDLDEIYGWRDIDQQTRFVGVVGFGPSEISTVRIFNAAFEKLGMNARCLPMGIGNFDRVKLMLDKLKVNALLTSKDQGSEMLPLAEHQEESAKLGDYADLLLHQKDGWHAYNSLWRSALKALEDTIGKKSPDEKPLDRRNVLVLGSGGLAKTLIFGIKKRQGLVSVGGGLDVDARKLSEQFGVRFVPSTNLYSTLADVVVLADPDLKLGTHKGELNPSYMRPPMTVLDVTEMPSDSPGLAEARSRQCKIVEPLGVYADQLTAQFKSVSGKELPGEILEELLPQLVSNVAEEV